MSAFELSHGFSKPIPKRLIHVPDEFIAGQQTLVAKRKPTQILRSKSLDNKVVHAEDLVEVFVKNTKEKRRHWTTPPIVLNAAYDSGTFTVPGSNKRTGKASMKT